ncbi:MAG: pilus assembly protein PilM [Candidatus Omnitrophica bacterium]|nr:pilus assembly protein PilM [Candidatus Omnitrophota bacterium]MDD5027079.1 pilus assembly protein PilM [Candidatus Omnitrophota bacterium]MDD5662082.1 pilus assembly protein PilM [Candidatus Omnitrophota bacterium]
MSDLGVYFGPKVIDVSETRGNKLVSSIQIPFSEVGGNELDEKVPAEVKLAASFNEAFRRNKIEVKEAMLCLSGKDLIIRTFEIPILPRDELKNAINFEAKKYIPFKIEELITDYQVEVDRASRANIVLFMGIKKETFDKYISILKPLNIRISSIEYSGFSILRMLKLVKLNESGITAVLCFDSQGVDEINFLVLENGFPLFNRDISLGSVPVSDFDDLEPSAPAFSMEKLKSEIRVSLDYYHRKFPSKSLKNIFVMSNAEQRQEIEVFLTELGLSGKFIDIAKTVGSPMAFSSSFTKSYSIAISRKVGIKVRLNLVESKLRGGKVDSARIQLELKNFFNKIKLDFRIIIVGVLVCAAALIYGTSREVSLKKELGKLTSKWSKLTSLSPNTSYEALRATSLKDRKAIVNLDNLVNKQLYVTEILNIIPGALPPGVWLTRISLDKKEGGGAELILEGVSYLNNGNNEFQAVNKFFSNLNNNPVFTGYFKDIKVSLDQGSFAGNRVTTFVISSKAKQ